MKIFITAPFRNGENQAEIDKLCSFVRQAGFEDYCFAKEQLEVVFKSLKEMMISTKEEIEKCDALLFDASVPSTSRALEAGIAYALGKKVVVVVKKGTVVKDSLVGISDMIITYDKIEDTQEKLKMINLKR